MVNLFTSDLERWLKTVETLTSDGGKWSVAASIYSAPGFAHTLRIGCRAAAWLPLGREMVIYDERVEVVPHTAEAQASQRDFLAAVERVEAMAVRLKLRYLPCLLDWLPEGRRHTQNATG